MKVSLPVPAAKLPPAKVWLPVEVSVSLALVPALSTEVIQVTGKKLTAVQPGQIQDLLRWSKAVSRRSTKQYIAKLH